MSKFFLKDTASVYRLTSASDKESYGANGTVTGHIQPLDAETSVLLGSQAGQAFAFYTETGVDLMVTDKIEIGTDTYIVRGKQEYDMGSFPHIKWTIERI
ncbi:MAG: hypothetical protein D6822_04375 [Cyanobacteria bacterium J149]|nr:MAG: hypothetical protein D6822_04375 [Cyanobacteria bacterium J149]